jgi:hypothetical protein
MQRQRFIFRNERSHPKVGSFTAHLFRDQTQAFPDSKDMSIHRKLISSQPEKKEAVNGLGADPFQISQGLFDRLRIHPFQEIEGEFPVLFLDPPEDASYPFCLLPRQPTGLNGPDHVVEVRFQDILPPGEPLFQFFKGPAAVAVVGVLGKDRSDQPIQEITPGSWTRYPEMSFQNPGNPSDLLLPPFGNALHRFTRLPWLYESSHPVFL